MKAKYLGVFYFDYVVVDGEPIEVLVSSSKGANEEYMLDQFMLTEPNSMFDGIMGETNTSAIAMKMTDSLELAKLWMIY